MREGVLAGGKPGFEFHLLCKAIPLAGKPMSCRVLTPERERHGLAGRRWSKIPGRIATTMQHSHGEDIGQRSSCMLRPKDPSVYP